MEGLTPLMLACQQGYDKIVSLLLEAGKNGGKINKPKF